MKVRIPFILLVVVMAWPAFAQQRGGGRGGAGVASPVIGDDGRVTFRLRAPEARTVILTGDFADDTPLEKNDKGVWSVTLGPIEPEMYVYSFIVDGVRILDPGNPRAKIGFTTSTIVSLLTIPTKEPEFYDVQDVPHGVLHTHLYKSESNGVIRELNVYTPPGYEENPDRRYPVLYLLHGANNDHHSWHRYGRANDILDNLLAKDAIEPFLVVMPLGYGGARVNGDGTGVGGGGRGRGGRNDLYEQDILRDIIPMIDAEYRTLADRRHRAIIGFSMGGGQSLNIGLNHLDVFSYVGGMSAAVFGDPRQVFGRLAEDPEGTNELIDLLWIACGKDDSLIDRSRNLSKFLTESGIKHTFLETEGAHHWRVWRRYLRDVAPLLFK